MTSEGYFINKNNFSRYKGVPSDCIQKSGIEGEMLFSIVIPTYGRTELLREAVMSCLNQTYKENFEILVVDNDPVRESSGEKVITELKSSRISYYRNRGNIGCLPNFNRCFELARSRYVIMLHTDDLLHPEFLDRVVPLLEEHDDIDMLIPGKTILRNGESSEQKGFATLARLIKREDHAVTITPKDFCLYNIVGGPLGIVMKRDACLKLGGFDEDVFPMSDYAFWVRFVQKHNVFCLPRVLGTYRFIGNISSDEGMQRSYIENEFKLISELLTFFKHKGMTAGYLYEYINYRVKVSGLDGDEIFVSLTGEKYRFRVMNKVYFVLMLAVRSVRFVVRLLKGAR